MRQQQLLAKKHHFCSSRKVKNNSKDSKFSHFNTSEENPLSRVRCLLMKPLIQTQMPSAVSRVNTSYLLTIGADVNNRTAFNLFHLPSFLLTNRLKALERNLEALKRERKLTPLPWTLQQLISSLQNLCRL